LKELNGLLILIIRFLKPDYNVLDHDSRTAILTAMLSFNLIVQSSAEQSMYNYIRTILYFLLQ